MATPSKRITGFINDAGDGSDVVVVVMLMVVVVVMVMMVVVVMMLMMIVVVMTMMVVVIMTYGSSRSSLSAESSPIVSNQ